MQGVPGFRPAEERQDRMTRNMETESKYKGREQTIVMVCLSASPSSKRVIRAAAGMLHGKKRPGIALYVSDEPMDATEGTQLYENIQYADRLGFEVISARSSDIALTVSEYAKRAYVTDLFVGQSAPPHLLMSEKPLSDRITDYLPDTFIHIIPDSMASSYPQIGKTAGGIPWNSRDVLTVLTVMAVATVLSVIIYHSRYSNANIITIYILGVFISSLITSHQIYGIMAALLYVLLFNFLFIDPRYTLLVYDSAYLVTYMVSVAAGLITGSLTSKMTDIARMSAENAYQAKILLDTSKQLEQASDTGEIIRITCRQLGNLLDRPVRYYGTGEEAPGRETDPKEPGQETDHKVRYVSISTEQMQYGVIGIDMQDKPLTAFENTVLHAILNEFTMALDNRRMIEERQRAELLAQNERLRSGLLRSISHDLRTPLTAIYGNATTLAENEKALTADQRAQIYADMRDDANWLIMQMENILSMTKLENKQYLNKTVENMEDVIEESLRHLKYGPEHTVEVIPCEDACFALMDARMISQVLINLLDNAFKYTTAGSEICVRTVKKDGRIYVSVEDEGGGISPEDKEHIFELFYMGQRRLEDSYRSMGIGLNLCYMIMQAHGGGIEVTDNHPKGSVFTFWLDEKEVPVNE